MSKTNETNDINDINETNDINNSFFCFLSCAMSRLGYTKMPDTLEKYKLIMDTIPEQMIKSIKKFKNVENIFNDELLFSNIEEKNFKTIGNKKFIDIIKLNLPQQINKIIGKKKVNVRDSTNTHVKIIEISNSNENKVCVIADKKINSIFVIFRGTDTGKAGTSWLNFVRDIPTNICDNTKNKFLTGVFKLCIETIHTLYYSICHLSNHFLNSKRKNSVKLFTTGHSLGGGLSTIFSYLWLGIKHENIDNVATNLNDKIVCVSLASPRVFNEYMVKHDLYKLLEKNKIVYRRIVTIGDTFTTQPFYLRQPINENSFSYCNQTLVEGKKQIDYDTELICKNKMDNKKTLSLLPHGNYMYIDFFGLLNVRQRNVLQSEYKDTVVKICIGETIKNKNEYKVVHFYLNDVRYGKSRKDYNPKRDIYIIDASRKEDMYMNLKIFNYIVKNAEDYNSFLMNVKKNTQDNIKETENTYVSKGRSILEIDFDLLDKPNKFICLTYKNMRKIVKNKTKKKNYS